MYNLVKISQSDSRKSKKCVLAEFNVGITVVTGVTAIIARFMELVTGITSPHLYTNFY